MKKGLLIILSLSLWTACSVSPVPIEYGSDMCHFCKMTIVDQQHGAEAVTSKGKIYKFDAIECMVQFAHKNKSLEFGYLLVNDYEDPGALISAPEASFLISDQIPSPMGAYLSAFSSKETTIEVMGNKGGQIYRWDELPNALNITN